MIEIKKIQEMIDHWKRLIAGIPEDNIQVRAIKSCIHDLEQLVLLAGGACPVK